MRSRSLAICLILALLAGGTHHLAASSGRDEEKHQTATEADSPGPSGSSVALDPAILRPVEHRTTGIRSAEREAYYRVLHHARSTDYAAQQAAAGTNLQQGRRAFAEEYPEFASPERDYPVFVHLLKDPEFFHGKLVTLEGHARKVVKYPAGENAYGIETLYEIWLYTENSLTYPAVIVTPSVPDGLPVGEALVDNIVVTGYFFKIYGYEARQEGLRRFAPMLLAQRVEWHPPPEGSVVGPLPAWVYGAVAAVVLGLVGLVWWVARRDREVVETRLRRVQFDEEPDFRELPPEETEEP